MDVTILYRLVPAVLVAWGIVWWGRRPRSLGDAFDDVLTPLVIGVVVGRLGWLALGGPRVWRGLGSTIYLMRAGVETWLGVGAAIGFLAWRTPRPEREAMLLVAPAATLAAVGIWQGLCGVEGVCAGVPVSWGVPMPGFASRVFPAGYVEAVLAFGLAFVAWRWRRTPAVSVGAAAGYALVRGLLGFGRAPLGSLPTRDQVLSFVMAFVLAVIAMRLRRRKLDHSGEAGVEAAAPPATEGPSPTGPAT